MLWDKTFEPRGGGACIEETFGLDKAGYIDLNLAYDGGWNKTGLGSVKDTLSFTVFLIVDGVRKETKLKDIAFPKINRKVDDVLTGSPFLKSGEHRMVAGIGISTTGGVINFSNTGTLLINADPSLGLTYSDPLFLSGKVGPSHSPVPVPAGGVLMMSTLAGFGFLNRWRERA